MVLSVLSRLSGSFARATGQRSTRRLGVFESESLDGYTDGSTVVFLNRRFLKIGGAAGNIMTGFDSLKALLLHEYLHDVEDSRGHGHPAEFFERFHDIISNDHSMVRFTYDASMLFLSMRRKAGAKMRAGDLKALDLVLVEDAEMPAASLGDDQASDLPRDTAFSRIEEPLDQFDTNGLELGTRA
jgi:hypothetical protein